MNIRSLVITMFLGMISVFTSSFVLAQTEFNPEPYFSAELGPRFPGAREDHDVISASFSNKPAECPYWTWNSYTASDPVVTVYQYYLQTLQQEPVEGYTIVENDYQAHGNELYQASGTIMLQSDNNPNGIRLYQIQGVCQREEEGCETAIAISDCSEDPNGSLTRSPFTNVTQVLPPFVRDNLIAIGISILIVMILAPVIIKKRIT